MNKQIYTHTFFGVAIAFLTMTTSAFNDVACLVEALVVQIKSDKHIMD